MFQLCAIVARWSEVSRLISGMSIVCGLDHRELVGTPKTHVIGPRARLGTTLGRLYGLGAVRPIRGNPLVSSGKVSACRGEVCHKHNRLPVCQPFVCHITIRGNIGL